MQTVPAAIDSVSGADMNPQLRHTLTHRLCVAKIARFDLSQSSSDPGFCLFVAECRDPLYKRRTSVLFLVVDEFDHGNECSIKATG